MDKKWDKLSNTFTRFSLHIFIAVAIVVIFLLTNLISHVSAVNSPNLSRQVSMVVGEHREGNVIPPKLQFPAHVSPFLFGTNLGLTSATDPFITDDTIRGHMQQAHITIIRMPTRIGGKTNPTIPFATEMAAAQKIHDMGAVPLVNLRGPADPTELQDNLQMVNGINGIFGYRAVFYELGNEADLAGFDKVAYTTRWNTIIPNLKSAALNGKFIGPVNFQYNDDYLRYFLHNAIPRPDAVSWHEYTCDTSGVFSTPPDTASDCLAHLDRWNIHFNDAHIAMHDTLGGRTEIPIFISEYNYDPHKPLLNKDSQFINAWTSKAFDILAKNNIFAAFQYSVLSLTPLISNGQLSMQGTVIKSQYETLERRRLFFSGERTIFHRDKRISHGYDVGE